MFHTCKSLILILSFFMIFSLTSARSASPVMMNPTDIDTFTETSPPDHTRISAAGGPEGNPMRNVQSNPVISHCMLCHQSPDQIPRSASPDAVDVHRCLMNGRRVAFHSGVDKTAGAPFSFLHAASSIWNQVRWIVADPELPLVQYSFIFFLICINFAYLEIHPRR